MEKPRPERTEPKEDPRVVAHRCPFCHEAVRPEAEAWVACAQCLGRQHAACWDEGGRCGACRHTLRLEAPAPARRGDRSATQLVIVFLALLVAGWLVGGVLLAPTDGGGSTLEPPAVFSPPPPPPPTVVATPASPERSDERRPPQATTELLGRGTPDERFDWLPDRIDADTYYVVNRMTKEARARIRQRPGEVASLVLEAHLAERWKDGAEAIRLCDEAIARDPLYGAAWTVRGWAMLGVGNDSVAALDLRRGAQLSHDPTWAWIGLGTLAELQGDTAAALKAYQEALRLGGARSARVDHEPGLRARIERLSAAGVTPPR